MDQPTSSNLEPTSLASLYEEVRCCMLMDQHRLRSRLRGVERSSAAGRPATGVMEQINADIERSRQRADRRWTNLPQATYPKDLPIVEHRDAIARAITEHQVIVLCGETGSGKTTQLPKICLELGRGVKGMIGHTQPRRIAARSVAARLASELQTSVGHAVGYKIRFGDRTSPDTYVKLMTDGILLAETQSDRFLNAYDTIIIDEAHERSLNIDFLLGYLKQLLPKRPDLKLIITSATIDPQRFSRHFSDAPIIEVSGRTYPVEVRYRPLKDLDDPDAEDIEEIEAILAAVDEVAGDEPGDVLIFLPGEREIRETAEALRKHHPPGVEVLPLFSRLSVDEQNKVFLAHNRRRIVLATNVAETSLTVPGIHSVIDTGLARISRYNPRTKVQRLPIEPISRASANQRAGRCGRVAPGICVRLYSEEDFNSRAEFTEPEILRTNLASVILQMKYLRLGDVQAFPFVEPPDHRAIKDGYYTLHELGAIDDRQELTDIGRRLARLPVDPRIGRMVLQSAEENCMPEVLIIASALSVQDPRERPLDKQQAADEAHARFRDEQSDFLSFLRLWGWYHAQVEHLSTNKLRKMCQQHFISYLRMREWHDVHQQLHAMVAEMGLMGGQRSVPLPSDEGAGRYDAIHRALLAGLLGNVGMKTDAFEYTGAGSKKFNIFPGSALFKTRPQWVMAGELVETTKLYARTVARIKPEWIERLAGHLVKRTYTEPHWNPQTAHVVAYERVTLYGLPIVPRRTVHYGPIEPKLSREIFIKSAFVDGEYHTTAPYWRENQKLLDEIETLEAKRRMRDVLVDEQVRYDFYDKKIPAGIHNGPAFEKWRRTIERDNPKYLYMQRRDLMRHAGLDADAELYPDTIRAGRLTLSLEYHLEPGHPADGVTVRLPLAALNQLPTERFEWIVPGFLKEKITALIKSLPKPLRVNFVPAPDVADAAFRTLKPGDGSLYDALAIFLSKRNGITVRPEDFDPQSLLDHLHMNFNVVDEAGKSLATGRDLAALRKQFGVQAREQFQETPEDSPWHRETVRRWDFGDLPESVEVKRHGMTLRGYPALVDAGDGTVSMRLFDAPETAGLAHRAGVRRLFMVQLEKDLKHLAATLPGFAPMALHYATLGKPEALRTQIIAAVADRAFGDAGRIRTQQVFVDEAGRAWSRLGAARDEVIAIVQPALAEYHALTMKLGSKMPPLWQEAIAEVGQQLKTLMPGDFITATPPEWLPHLARFLKAAHLRLQKLGDAGHVRDAQRARSVKPLWEQYLGRRAKHAKEGIYDPALMQYRWMLEEFRVSIFAQELKTSVPVSEKRLEAQWALVKP